MDSRNYRKPLQKPHEDCTHIYGAQIMRIFFSNLKWEDNYGEIHGHGWFKTYEISPGLISDVQAYKYGSTKPMANYENEQNNDQEGFRNFFNSIMKHNAEKARMYRNILEQENVRKQRDFEAMKEEFQSLRRRSAQKQGNILHQNAKAAVVKRETPPNDMQEPINEEEPGDDEDDGIYDTRYPYPRTPVEMNWSYEMSTLTYDDSKKVHYEIGMLLTQLITTLSRGNPKLKLQLTLFHTWVPFKGVHCFDSLRLMLSVHCVEWKLSEFARRYGYVLVNMCNAKWLNEEDIEEAMARTCDKKRIPDDKCA